jgi:Cu2+-containing amine oxidase
MNLVKSTIEVIRAETAKKANEATKMKLQQPDKAEFWQGQYQAFTEIHTMLTLMSNIKG